MIGNTWMWLPTLLSWKSVSIQRLPTTLLLAMPILFALSIVNTEVAHAGKEERQAAKAVKKAARLQAGAVKREGKQLAREIINEGKQQDADDASSKAGQIISELNH